MSVLNSGLGNVGTGKPLIEAPASPGFLMSKSFLPFDSRVKVSMTWKSVFFYRLRAAEFLRYVLKLILSNLLFTPSPTR